ncbi:MAG TPA: AMP-binding protein [Bosea sp. (in: a-proteobacteria)]|jgi:crotonobetaine/carnitine-CoA ligase|uniref:class I adenylate-forming enzyme family protein n=1 Tax=Bosea sp. (in: a-proteobacteria) TaxID=1871050 RepID=UPI002DDD18C5|nr:AMP-binding protein [Bosea sp. (in: a-proteobacteria)]HEV2555404.1 AMP-binding protein [Bosea sp. (in: a-proteobacteria)]
MTSRDDSGFVDLLTQFAARDPGRVYARYCGEPVTYGEIERSSSAFAAHLRARGLKPGDRVAVMMRNSVAAIAVVFGLARAGVAWVPVNAQQRGEGLRYLLTHSQPKLVVADEDLAALVTEALAGAGAPPLLRQGPELDRILAEPAVSDEPAPAPDAVFAVMYTSGTTGRPKGVVVSHRMLRLAAEGVGRVSAAKPGEVFFVWEPLYHIGGAQLLPLPMIRDVTLAMVDRFSASRFWSQVKAEGATHIHHLGGILQILLKQPESPLDRTHGVRISWGGGCPADIWPLFRDRFGIEIRECYGMTEASSITTCNDNGVVGSVGKPMPWFTVRLLRTDGTPVAVGERGEIVVETDIPGAIFPGYLDNPEATAKALRGGALHTGDLGSWDEAGNLFFHGRMTDSVRCKGENVSAWEVEHVAAEHEDIEDCAMIGVASDVGEQDIKLFVKPREGTAIDPAALSDWLAARLAPYQNPRYIAFVDEFERTASQRIMKHKLSPRLDDAWDRSAPVMAS